jgi:hypothetical protein
MSALASQRCFAHQVPDTDDDATSSEDELVDAPSAPARARGPPCLAKTFELMGELGSEEELATEGEKLLSTMREFGLGQPPNTQDSVGHALEHVFIPVDIQNAPHQTLFSADNIAVDRVQKEIHSIFAVTSTCTITSKRCNCNVVGQNCNGFCIGGGNLPSTTKSFTTISVPLSAPGSSVGVDISGILTPPDFIIDRPVTVDDEKAFKAIDTSFQLGSVKHTIVGYNPFNESWAMHTHPHSREPSFSEKGVENTLGALGTSAPEAMASALVSVRDQIARNATKITVPGNYVLIIGGGGHSNESSSLRGELDVCETVDDCNGVHFHLIGAAVFKGTQHVLKEGTSYGHYSFLCRTNNMIGGHSYTYLDNGKPGQRTFSTSMQFAAWMKKHLMKAHVLLFRRSGTWEYERLGLPIPRSQLGLNDNNCWLAVSILLLFMIPSYKSMVASCASADLGTNGGASRQAARNRRGKQVQSSSMPGSSTSARSNALGPHKCAQADDFHASDRRNANTPPPPGPPGATDTASNEKENGGLHFDNVRYHYRPKGTSESTGFPSHTWVEMGTLTVNHNTVHFQPISGTCWSVFGEWRPDKLNKTVMYFRDDTYQVAFSFQNVQEGERAYAAIARNAADLVPGFLVEHGGSQGQKHYHGGLRSNSTKLQFVFESGVAVENSGDVMLEDADLTARASQATSIRNKSCVAVQSSSGDMLEDAADVTAPTEHGSRTTSTRNKSCVAVHTSSGVVAAPKAHVSREPSSPIAHVSRERSIRIQQVQHGYITELGRENFLKKFKRDEQNPVYENTTIRPCNVPDGTTGKTMRGVETIRHVSASELICEYPGTIGEVKDVRDAEESRQENGCDRDEFELGSGYTVETLIDEHGHKFALDGTPNDCDPSKPTRIPAGRHGNLLNHARTGARRCNVKPIVHRTRLLLVASKDILVGTELRWDYDELKQMGNPPAWLHSHSPLPTPLTMQPRTKPDDTPSDSWPPAASTNAPKQLTFSESAPANSDQTPNPRAHSKQFTQPPKSVSFLGVMKRFNGCKRKREASNSGDQSGSARQRR